MPPLSTKSSTITRYQILTPELPTAPPPDPGGGFALLYHLGLIPFAD